MVAEVRQAGLDVVEMPRNGVGSFCCGAGGARMWMEESIGVKVNDERAREAISTGASRVATACPFCNLMLTSSAAKHTEQRKVFDVAELTLERLEVPSA